MPIYTAEIDGRGIAAFDAADLVAAEDWVHSTVFLEDLFRLETDEAALWVRSRNLRPARAPRRGSEMAGVLGPRFTAWRCRRGRGLLGRLPRASG